MLTFREYVGQLDESYERARAIAKKYTNSEEWHEEAVEVAEEALHKLDLSPTDKKKTGVKNYLKKIIKSGTPQWHEEAIQTAEDILAAL